MLQPDRYRLTSIDIGRADSESRVAALDGQSGLFVVAIGQAAARVARDELDTPVVFTQVFNYQELLVEGRPIRGVAPMPPLDLQLQEWRRIDPGLERVGLIVSDRHTHLIAEAEEAAADTSVLLTTRTSGSDQETLYLFRRLAGGIDGFWLVPDDRILSPSVLREVLDYAVSHGVRVTVFSDALLSWGHC